MLNEANNKYRMYQGILKKTDYLINITEDIIYDAYRQAIKRDHSQPFT